MKVFTQISNPLTGSLDWGEQPDEYDYHQEIARSAFADMLHDTERNKLYYQSLDKAIKRLHDQGKKANVLDIGTGTGLLSIMAARCGADSIVACEAFEPMADCALKILRHNQVADKVTLIPKRSTDLVVGEDGDMKERANILVTEVFDTELIGEGAIGTFSHAHQHLLTEDCIVVPASAVVYAQVVQCDEMQKWNRLEDLIDRNESDACDKKKNSILLITPQTIRQCPGSSAVHDIQLSQLPAQEFRQLSEPLPVFSFDWSGQSVLNKRRDANLKFKATEDGVAQMVFMWWELDMDGEGLKLSCAPWWAHPDACKKNDYPQDSIPWRDHWMQAVYYFQETSEITSGRDYILTACHDEYSLWFNMHEDYVDTVRPICVCGLHMIFSRTQVLYLNSSYVRNSYLSDMREFIDKRAVVLNLNGGSLFGLAAAVMGAKKVYYIESNKFVLDILKEYTKENQIKNVEVVKEIDNVRLEDVTHVIGDPSYVDAILPWDNLRMAHVLYKYKEKLSKDIQILPKKFDLVAIPVKFLNLQKIRTPLKVQEHIDLAIFDQVVEESRQISDSKLEPQPLWEYPCICQGQPHTLLSIDLTDLQATYTQEGNALLRLSPDTDAPTEVNGIVLWSRWHLNNNEVSFGPIKHEIGKRMTWQRMVRQTVFIPEKSRFMKNSDTWWYKVDCDLEKGNFHVDINL